MQTNDVISIVVGAFGAWAVAIQPDMSEMFWGAVGGYVAMSRSAEGGTLKSQIGTLAASALCAAALTDLAAHVGHQYAPTVAVKAVGTATAFLLGWGFFKVADPLVAMGLEATKAFLTRLSGGSVPANPAPNEHEEGGQSK